jgi:hypothetical protein
VHPHCCCHPHLPANPNPPTQPPTPAQKEKKNKKKENNKKEKKHYKKEDDEVRGRGAEWRAACTAGARAGRLSGSACVVGGGGADNGSLQRRQPLLQPHTRLLLSPAPSNQTHPRLGPTQEDKKGHNKKEKKEHNKKEKKEKKEGEKKNKVG